MKIQIKKEYIKKILIAIPVVLILVFAIQKRINSFGDKGKDIDAYKRAITDFFSGVNPYIWTIESYNMPDDIGNHGYAYLPGLLYLFGSIYKIDQVIDIGEYYVAWKIPVFLADIAVGLVLFSYFYKRNPLFSIFAIFFWFYNPYNMFKTGYTYTDTIPVLLSLIALLYLEKSEIKSGIFLSLAILFKTYPIILLPVFLILSKDKVKFILSCAITGVISCLPFLTSMDNFLTMLNGSIFVHSSRVVTGRPFLFYISYFYDVEFFQIVPLYIYSYLAMLFGWVFVPILYFVFKLKNKYILSMLVFLNFFIFTPVLNRTYVLWLIVPLIFGVYEIFKNRKIFYYITLIGFHIFYSWYMLQWKDGFHIWRPM